MNKSKTQTVDTVAASLLKQIAWPPDQDRPYLKFIYDKISGERPTHDTIIDLFIECTKLVKVRVLFDAIDEYKESERGEVYQLIEKFRDADIGVYLTTRPHITSLLQAEFPDAVYMENIKADQKDVQNALELRIKGHRPRIDVDFMNEIVHKIGNSQKM